MKIQIDPDINRIFSNDNVSNLIQKGVLNTKLMAYKEYWDTYISYINDGYTKKEAKDQTMNKHKICKNTFYRMIDSLKCDYC